MDTLDINESKTLLEFLVDLLSDKEALAAFQHDPEGVLKAAGLEDVRLEDLQESLCVILEKDSPEECAKYEDDCDEDRCYDDKWQDYCEDEHHHGKHYDDCDDDHGRSHHDVEIHKVITHLTYVTNNFTIDNSINVWNAGDGDVLIVNGDGNIIGDNNVTGDGNTFGNDNVKETFGDNNVVGDFNGSGNINGELNLDLGLGGLPTFPLPGADTFDGELAGLSIPNDASSLVDDTEEEPETTSEETVVEDDDEPSYTEINGHGNIVGNGNVTGDGNTFGDGNTDSTFGDNNVVGNGNGSGNVDLSADVDLGGGDEPADVDSAMAG